MSFCAYANIIFFTLAFANKYILPIQLLIIIHFLEFDFWSVYWMSLGFPYCSNFKND